MSTVVYIRAMLEVVETDVFRRWMSSLKDAMARARIAARLRRATMDNLGDWKFVGAGVAEMRIDHGPGYRVYFVRRGHQLIVILAGGTKRTQEADIRKAIEAAQELKE